MNSCRGRIRKLLEINRSLKFEKEEEEEEKRSWKMVAGFNYPIVTIISFINRGKFLDLGGKKFGQQSAE